MSANVLYADRLVRISDDSILLRDYYFPFGSKRIGFDEIASVNAREPRLLNGKYRIYGSGDLRTWFPPDWKRPTRDRIFIIHLRRQWHRVGFTVEDSRAVERILKEKRLLDVETRAA